MDGIRRNLESMEEVNGDTSHSRMAWLTKVRGDMSLRKPFWRSGLVDSERIGLLSLCHLWTL